MLLREITRKGPGREGLHAVSGFWAICSITRVLPKVGIAVKIVEHWCWGEAYCVCIISGSSKALWW